MKGTDRLLSRFGSTIGESTSHRGAPAAMPIDALGATLGGERLAGTTRIKGALDVDISRIERDPEQPREEFDMEALSRLATSIGRAGGILTPIRVRFDEPAGLYRIIAGERRWRAAKIVGLAKLPCIVDDRPLTKAELLADQVTENALREDLKPGELARAYRALMDLNGWSGNQLAKELGVSQPSVSEALALLGLAAPVLAAVDAGEVPAYAALAMKDLPAEDQALVKDEFVSGNIRNRAEVKAKVASLKARPDAKGRGASKARKVTSQTLRTSDGHKITIEHRRGIEDGRLAAALEEALATVRNRMTEGTEIAA